jgi:hypothetical protein
MAYLVEFSARAAHDLEVLYIEKGAADSDSAARWYNGLEEAVDALGWYPHRCPLAPGNAEVKAKAAAPALGQEA